MLEAKRLSGPGVGAVKYDLLTAMSVAALNRTMTEQRSILRLIALVTARYNWARDELTTGQADMARMWGVAVRTAKREVKRLIGMGMILVLETGVRGRVSRYRLNRSGIFAYSRTDWSRVGSDFNERMTRTVGEATPQDKTADKIVRVQFGAQDRAGEGPWDRVLDRLQEGAPEDYANWFRRLSLETCQDGTVSVRAPNPFVRDYVATHLKGVLSAAVAREFGDVQRLDILTGQVDQS